MKKEDGGAVRLGASSSAYVSCEAGGRTYTYHFTGVTSISHSLSLNLEKTASQGTDIVNGARNLASQVTLAVVETDVEHVPGWSARMLECMAAIKKNRYLCRVVTSMAAYDDMLLKEITATQDGDNQFGWSGELVFTEYIPAAEAGAGDTKTNDNSSSRTNMGSGAVRRLTDGALLSLLRRAGISDIS